MENTIIKIMTSSVLFFTISMSCLYIVHKSRPDTIQDRTLNKFEFTLLLIALASVIIFFASVLAKIWSY